MIGKLTIENWKRRPYVYETAFEGEQYHLVRNREDHLLNIQKNEVSVDTAHKMVPRFDKNTGRKEILLPLNEKRFMSFNTNPTSCTKVRRVTSIDFSKQKGREK